MKKIVLFFTFLVFGLWISNPKSLDRNREPAAVRAHYDFSQFTSEKKQLTLKDHISKSFAVKITPEKIRLQFGFISFIDEAKDIKTICSVYSKVTFVIEAEGEAHNGEKPQMKVSAPCKESGTFSSGELVIPVDALIANPAADGDVQFFEPNPTSFTFKNMGDSWPQQWVVKSIELDGKNAQLQIKDFELGSSMNIQARSFQLPVVK